MLPGVLRAMFGSLDCDVETVMIKVMMEVYRHESPLRTRTMHILAELVEVV